MSEALRFHVDQRGFLQYDAPAPRLIPLGLWIKMDLGGNPGALLEALDLVDEAERTGEPPVWDGESFEVEFAREGVHVIGHYTNADQVYPLEEVRATLERHWRFVRDLPEAPGVERLLHPHLPAWQAYLRDWEERAGRPHPYRGRIGIPA